MDKERKEIRCKKCNKLLAVVNGKEIEFTIKTKAKVTPIKYELKCRICGKVRKGKIQENLI
ncbi:hypothetical protein NRK67_00540 [Fusobacteria bacterium ZRK30]|nr:hypothetical protein NRK67_00540 [Fusobacteria bacterium ZRK30]